MHPQSASQNVSACVSSDRDLLVEKALADFGGFGQSLHLMPSYTIVLPLTVETSRYNKIIDDHRPKIVNAISNGLKTLFVMASTIFGR
uniref:Uncharacterized protein n=1 Tax=Tetranychus urticae TaxID=32264 RepID=T1K6N6_TETUR